MHVLLLDAPQAMLDERRRLGLDGRDEMWNGVLHVVPPPKGPHQRFSGTFFRMVAPLAERHGLVPHMETGLFESADNYKVPDQVYSRPEHLSDRGVEGAEAVIEVRSGGDETYAKFDFYAALGVREVLVLHPDERRVELFRLIGGRLLPVTPDASGELASDVLGIRIRTVDGKLRITWAGGAVDI